MAMKKAMEVVKSVDLQRYMGRWYFDLVVNVSKLQQFFPPRLPLPSPPEEVNEPPEPTYDLKIRVDLENLKALSCLQIEILVCTCQRHLQHLPNGERAGFFVGDEAGVGKGQTIAGLIWENWHRGMRKAVISYSGFLLHPNPVMALDRSSIASKIVMAIMAMMDYFIGDMEKEKRLTYTSGIWLEVVSIMIHKNSFSLKIEPWGWTRGPCSIKEKRRKQKQGINIHTTKERNKHPTRMM
ncbi:hypothetical protein EV1_039990 [Malus domestica]